MNIQEIEREIQKINNRNKKVEKEKAWETSLTRKITIAILTYLVVLLFFLVAKITDPFVNAVVPSLAFLFSTLTLPLVRSIWMKKNIG